MIGKLFNKAKQLGPKATYQTIRDRLKATALGMSRVAGHTLKYDPHIDISHMVSVAPVLGNVADRKVGSIALGTAAAGLTGLGATGALGISAMFDSKPQVNTLELAVAFLKDPHLMQSVQENMVKIRPHFEKWAASKAARSPELRRGGRLPRIQRRAR